MRHRAYAHVYVRLRCKDAEQFGSFNHTCVHKNAENSNSSNNDTRIQTTTVPFIQNLMHLSDLQQDCEQPTTIMKPQHEQSDCDLAFFKSGHRMATLALRLEYGVLVTRKRMVRPKSPLSPTKNLLFPFQGVVILVGMTTTTTMILRVAADPLHRPRVRSHGRRIRRRTKRYLPNLTNVLR